MKLNRKSLRNGQTMHPALAITVGVSVSLVVSLLLSAITAYLVNSGKILQGSIESAIVCVYLTASFAGCMAAHILHRHKPAILAAVTCTGYFLILFLFNILFNSAQLNGAGKGIVSIIAGGVLSIFPGLGKYIGRKQANKRFS